jgi:thiol-disulfide isomerase/thioredoxin
MTLRKATLICVLGLALALSFSAQADSTQRYVLDIKGMTCSGCASTVKETLMGSKGIESTFVSHLAGKACVATSGALDAPAVGAALKIADYEMTAHVAVATCPDNLRGKLPDPWEKRSEGLNVESISQGEEFDLKAKLVKGNYTIIDFGAPWCEPCHDAADLLVAYLTSHSDVAVRAVNLNGQNPEESYQQPVVAQHLQYVKGVPWFLVYAPDGKVLYRGTQVDKAMSSIDKHRTRAAKKK